MEGLDYFKSAYVEIGNFILNALNIINMKEVELFVDALINVYKSDKKVLVVGAGRSGLVGRAFAMRLMHLGFRSYVLGETITPSVGEGDLVVAISGSGTTTMVVAAAEAAKKMRAKVVAITSYRDSPLANYADLVVQVLVGLRWLQWMITSPDRYSVFTSLWRHWGHYSRTQRWFCLTQ